MNAALIILNVFFLVIIILFYLDRQKRMAACEKHIDPLVKRNLKEIMKIYNSLQQNSTTLILVERVQPDDVFLLGGKR